MKEIMIYLKTTETCNLNCKHCFTNGISGRKIYFDDWKSSVWLYNLAEYYPDLDHVHVEFHGGEPFLAPLEDMRFVYESSKNLWPSMSWGATTNLTFKLTDEIKDFIKGPLDYRIATSWDTSIRFATIKQRLLWEKNVKTLIDEGVTVKLFVSVTKPLLDMEPIDLLRYVKDLGITEMDLERLTHNGSANEHPEIFPRNIDQDAWFLKMYNQMIEYNARDWLDNTFIENVIQKFESGFTKSGTFCRDCEEKLFTINADGTIAGCPNSAPEENFGHIDEPIETLINKPTRLNNIACERNMNEACYSCPVFAKCGGDCHQLEWQGNVCGAPKSLMLHLQQNAGSKTFHIVGRI